MTEQTTHTEEPAVEETTTEEPLVEEPETFPREYVERLRKENAAYREKAKDRDDLAHRLHTALTAADGRLAASEELPFDEAHLTDPQALTDAIAALIDKKPYLAARRVVGDVGQGATPTTPTLDLAGILRANA